MTISKEYFSVNWTDGMRLSSSHLLEQEQYFESFVRGYSCLFINENRFGLLPSDTNAPNSVKLIIDNLHGEGLLIKLSRCFTITRDGHIIAVNENYVKDFPLKVSCTNLKEDKTYIIFVQVQIDKYVLTGPVRPDEMPIYHPYKLHKYSLHLEPEDQFNNNDLHKIGLVIGKIVSRDEVITFDNSFIPCCYSVNSHQDLVDAHMNFGKLIAALQEDTMAVIKNILNQEQSPNGRIRCIYLLSEKILYYLNNIRFSYRHTALPSSVIDFVNYFSTFATNIITFFGHIATSDKEETIIYFSSWLDCKPGFFEKIITNCAHIDYNHYDIRGSLNVISEFMNLISSLYKKLSVLNLIGQERDNIIIAEQSLNNRSGLGPNANKWSIID